MSKESKAIGDIFVGTSVTLLFLEMFVNYRLWSQSNRLFEVGHSGLESFLSIITQSIIGLFSFAGIEWALLAMKLAVLFALIVYVFVGRPSAKDERPSRWTYMIAIVGTAVYFLVYLFSPYYLTLEGRGIGLSAAVAGIGGSLLTYLMISYAYGKIGRWVVYGGSSGMKGSMEEDPFGHEERRFAQTTEKIENEFSVNIPYKFTSELGKLQDGWINFINPFRAVQVLGTPGSGKSYTFFLAAIDQMISKGYCMLIYDFKYRELSEYALSCLKMREKSIKKFGGIVPSYHVITFDKVFESERCNVLQPQLWKDFTIDAYGQSNIFLTALNRSWSTKEGDFFPESAKNICAAGMWALKRYKNGQCCTLAHLIEFLSMDTKSIIKCLIALKDNSLSNVIRPFEEALEDGAMEQLQGQMGTVRIALSRLTSPVVYWITTVDPSEEAFSLEINRKDSPKILCLGSSAANQMINNIFFSLYISQIFRLVNVEGRQKLGVILDEVTTLSFPKGTLDTLIATGRSKLISIWLGYQDLSQLVRDFSRDVAEALFKMIGNTVAGNVEDDTADRLMKRIGKMRIMKKSMSIGAEGQPSFSFSENYDYAVPESFFGGMSQGTFAGKVADNFDEKISTKAFYGESSYAPPFNEKKPPERIKPTLFWKSIFENDCKEMSEVERNEYCNNILQSNFERVRQEIQDMKEELITA